MTAEPTQPLDIAQWPTTGVDLETRRRRVLAALAAMGRTAEQEQFRTTLAKRTRAALPRTTGCWSATCRAGICM
jgi:hypothetical protein